MEENNNPIVTQKGNQKSIAGAIVVAGLLIAGAILLKGSGTTSLTPGNVVKADPAKVTPRDNVLGNYDAKVTVIMYEDFQCPFCGAVSGLQADTAPLIKSLKQRDPTWTPIMTGLDPYLKNGTVKFVYRDFSFLGEESFRSAEAARCAGDQNKFWQYHDYLYSHQNGENNGAFSDTYLKSFAKTLSLDTASFDKCMDESKHAQAVLESTNEAKNAGVTGTPKGFILKGNKVVGTIDGAESFVTVKPRIDTALK